MQHQYLQLASSMKALDWPGLVKIVGVWPLALLDQHHLLAADPKLKGLN